MSQISGQLCHKVWSVLSVKNMKFGASDAKNKRQTPPRKMMGCRGASNRFNPIGRD